MEIPGGVCERLQLPLNLNIWINQGFPNTRRDGFESANADKIFFWKPTLLKQIHKQILKQFKFSVFFLRAAGKKHII
jgi:hypothetical protein